MSIWARSPHQRFKLFVGGANLDNKQFAGPWEAYSVVVGNHTNQHLYLPDAEWYVPPGVVGNVVPIPGLMQATAKFQAPPGITDLAAVNGQMATLDFFAEELPPHPGVPTLTGVPTTVVTALNVPVDAERYARTSHLGSAVPSTGSLADLNLLHNGTQVMVVDRVIASLQQVNGGAFAFDLQYKWAGIGLITSFGMGVSATAGDKDHLVLEGLEWAIPVGQDIELVFDNSLAGVRQRIAAFGWFR